MPNCLNGTKLSQDEFADSLWLQLRLALRGLPDGWDGCGHRFSFGHAMACRKGGLVLLHHNSVAGKGHHLYAQALSPAAVSDKPLIHSGWAGNAGAAGQGSEPPPDLRSNVGIHIDNYL